MTDYTVRYQCIHTIKETIPEIKLSLPFSRVGWEALVFLPKFTEMVLQQIELHCILHVNASELTRMAPKRFGQQSRIRNRLIEMHRSNVKPVFLPASK